MSHSALPEANRAVCPGKRLIWKRPHNLCQINSRKAAKGVKNRVNLVALRLRAHQSGHTCRDVRGYSFKPDVCPGGSQSRLRQRGPRNACYLKDIEVRVQITLHERADVGRFI